MEAIYNHKSFWGHPYIVTERAQNAKPKEVKQLNSPERATMERAQFVYS